MDALLCQMRQAINEPIGRHCLELEIVASVLFKCGLTSQVEILLRFYICEDGKQPLNIRFRTPSEHL